MPFWHDEVRLGERKKDMMEDGRSIGEMKTNPLASYNCNHFFSSLPTYSPTCFQNQLQNLEPIDILQLQSLLNHTAYIKNY